jgi:hypothetical protein
MMGDRFSNAASGSSHNGNFVDEKHKIK